MFHSCADLICINQSQSSVGGNPLPLPLIISQSPALTVNFNVNQQSHAAETEVAIEEVLNEGQEMN